MRNVYLLAGFAIFISAAGASAAEPAPPIAPAQPMLLTASATACNGAITLHLRTVTVEPATQEMVIRTPVKETAIVNGRVVEQNRFVEERRQITIMRPVPGVVIDVPLDGLAVVVSDLKGKPVTPANVTRLLKKETAVLVSTSGPVDPYYLQTTKLGTLIVQMPAQFLNPPTELLAPRRADSSSPPVAPPQVDPGEPPIAPTGRNPRNK
jgi:hypothetical protein